MAKNHRKVLVRIIVRAALVLVALDVMVFLAVWRPVAHLETTAWDRLSDVRRRAQEAQTRVSHLERFRAKLPTAREQLAAFEHDHVPPRRQGFSRVARLVRRLSEQSGLELSGVAYRLEAGGKEPLERLGVELNLEGDFPDLLKFTHALETASDMIVLRDFTFGPGESGRIGMRLTADLYLTP
jgi:Tfp pilus assembly protein PilO